MKGKGFYAALALCIIAAGAAAYIGVNNTLDGIIAKGDNAAKNNSSNGVGGNWDNHQVGDIVSGVPITPGSSTSSNSSQSGGQSQNSSNSSQQSQQQQKPREMLFISPISGSVSNPFSENKLVKSVTLNEWRTHDGIDIEAPEGTTVKATCDGTVSKVYTDALWGNVVEIEHQNGYVSIYSGLSENPTVKKGQAVSIGQAIGTVSKSAIIEASEPSHLHFAMKQNGKWINPAPLIDSDYED